MSAIFYFGIFFITGILAELSVSRKGFEKYFFGFLTVLVPAFFAGIREGIGTDYYVTYEPYFNSLKSGGSFSSVRDSLEIGYTLINRLVLFLGGDFHWVLFIVAALTFSFLLRACYRQRESIYVGLAVFLFCLAYYQVSFNIMRQVLAATIILNAYEYIEEKQTGKFLLYVLFATLFHTSALIIIPFYFILNFVSGSRRKIISFIIYIAIIWAVFNFDRFQVVLGFFDQSGYYSGYLRKISDFSMSFGLILRILPYLLAYFLVRKDINFTQLSRTYINAFAMGNIMRLIVYMTQFDADRIALYFLMPHVIIVSYLAKSLEVEICGRFVIRGRLKHIFVVCFLVICEIALWYFDMIYMGRNETLPYTCIFGKIQ